MEKRFYITTPLYYPSGKWHLGHSYTTVLCDAIARFKRMQGYNVFYLTGTDEHGQKIADNAAKQNKQPKEYVDGLVDEIKNLWRVLNISYDKFIRTTDAYHKKSVQVIFDTLLKKGDIYKGAYKGKYCTPCEAFWTDSQLKEGNCPDCGRPVVDFSEECYFFKLSKYAGKIEKLLTGTDFLQPRFRVAEMVNNFIKPGLADLAVSRTTVKWGIEVLNDPKHVVYVWIDALSNYINALGYNGGNKDIEFWPADVHMVGKEIVRFHSIIWPALLMALDLPLPKKVYGHGWLLLDGDKMSKSKGNVQDPFVLVNRYGVDAVRYYLLREIPFGQDGVFTEEGFLNRINSDLVNDLGNLVKRTVAMANQYFGGVIKVQGLEDNGTDKEFIEYFSGLGEKAAKQIDALNCPLALEEVFNVIKRANKYIDETVPWVLYKKGEKERLLSVLYNLLESIRVSATYLLPFIPDGAKRVFDMLNLNVPSDFKNAVFGKQKSYKELKDEILYKRLDIKEELKELEKLNHPVKAADTAVNAGAVAEPHKSAEEFISIEDFEKCRLVVAKVMQAEKVEKADKLLKLTLDAGGQTRTVVSGIAKNYTPEVLIGKSVVLLSNLKPIKLRGIESKGMILCAADGENVILLTPEKDIKSGSEIS